MELRRAYKSSPAVVIFIVYGFLYDSVINIYKPFAIKLLERLEGNDFHIALYNSMPGFVAVLALIPGTMVMSRFRGKKNIISVLLFISRSFLLFLAAIPFLPAQIQPLLFVMVVSFMNFPESISQTGLQGFLGNVFPDNKRARAIALRNKFGNIMIPVATLTTGLIISFLPANDSERLRYYQYFFLAAFAIGMVEIFVFRRFKEKAVSEIQKINIHIFGEIFRNKKFIRYMLTTLLFQFTWQMGWAIGTIYQIRVLGANEIWLALFTVSSGLAAFFSANFWGKRIYKQGNHKVQTLAAFLLGISIILHSVTPVLPVMIIVVAIGGFASLGINTSLFNGLLNSTPDENRLPYLGVYNTFVNLSLFISPLVGNVLLNLMGLVPALVVIGFLRIFAAGVLYIFGKSAQSVMS